MKKFDEAKNFYEKAILLNPKLEIAYVRLALLQAS